MSEAFRDRAKVPRAGAFSGRYPLWNSSGVQPMSSADVNDFIHNYLPVTIASAAQLIFLLLPISLKSWKSDFLNAWTYVGFQTFMGALLFVAVPELFELRLLSMTTTHAVLLLIFLASWWKVAQTIPLEGSLVVLDKQHEQPQVSFDSFFKADRIRQLSDLRFDEPSEKIRHQELREMLLRRRVEPLLGPSEDA
jgi:hypothetical protein